ncbi:MAG TPA: CoA-transferase [Rhodoblastus sp.]|nr:CoA-transferase [Rhodoblastus sp.]
MSECTSKELLIYTIAGLLKGVRRIAVGMSSPMPAAGAMLHRALERQAGGEPVQISILGSVKHNWFTGGSEELFDCAAQGRLDAFFLGGGQIDGRGNVNLVGAGAYPQTEVRWPGSYGSAYLYFLIPRVILFREEHSPRVLVDKVDFISAPGTSDAGLYRKGGPHALLTNAALFSFDREGGRFRLESVHPGVAAEKVREMTGFDYENVECSATTPLPDAATLHLMRTEIREQLSETYPHFAANLPKAA